MKNNVSILFFFLFCNILLAQYSYKKDSLQIKVYTELYVSNDIKIDSIKILKIFCDYCNEQQIKHIEKESFYRTKMEFRYPEYHKTGKYKLTLFLRISKNNFSDLKNDK